MKFALGTVFAFLLGVCLIILAFTMSDDKTQVCLGTIGFIIAGSSVEGLFLVWLDHFNGGGFNE